MIPTINPTLGTCLEAHPRLSPAFVVSGLKLKPLGRLIRSNVGGLTHAYPLSSSEPARKHSASPWHIYPSTWHGPLRTAEPRLLQHGRPKPRVNPVARNCSSAFVRDRTRLYSVGHNPADTYPSSTESPRRVNVNRIRSEYDRGQCEAQTINRSHLCPHSQEHTQPTVTDWSS